MEIRLSRQPAATNVLGPGRRAVLYVQGCDRHCPGCISPDTWERSGGMTVAVADVATWFVRTGLSGLTLTGGEPMLQAQALAELTSTIRAVRIVDVVCYTGYTLDELRQEANPGRMALLAETDLLIDGPYLPELHADLLWRGSRNQRLILLSDRIRPDWQLDQAGVGVEVYLSEAGEVLITGVPGVRDFRWRLERALADNQISLGEARPE